MFYLHRACRGAAQIYSFHNVHQVSSGLPFGREMNHFCSEILLIFNWNSGG